MNWNQNSEPLSTAEPGDIDRLWNMIYYPESGVAS
jgi:hypothetical protein